MNEPLTAVRFFCLCEYWHSHLHDENVLLCTTVVQRPTCGTALIAMGLAWIRPHFVPRRDARVEPGREQGGDTGPSPHLLYGMTILTGRAHMAKITLYGFSGSTYVRTIRMLLAEKGVTDYVQIPVDVLKGEPKQPEHLARHPFGKVPVVDVDGFRIIETPAIGRYLDATLPGARLVPADAQHAARMDMVIGIIDSYGYGALLAGVVAYHLFPDFVGGKNEAVHHAGLVTGKLVLAEIIRIQGVDPFLAGPAISLADLYLAPIMAYICLTPHRDEFLALPGVGTWWTLITNRQSYLSTEP